MALDEFYMDVEEKFGIRISPKTKAGLRTFRQTVNYVETRTSRHRDSSSQEE